MSLIIVTPRMSEKAYAQAQNGTYVFDVPMTANKQQITDAIAAQYDVKVVSVTSLVQSGKAVRFSRGKNRYPGTTTRKDTKKAYVRLADGDSIKVFADAAEEEKK